MSAWGTTGGAANKTPTRLSSSQTQACFARSFLTWFGHHWGAVLGTHFACRGHRFSQLVPIGALHAVQDKWFGSNEGSFVYLVHRAIYSGPPLAAGLAFVDMSTCSAKPAAGRAQNTSRA